MKDDRVGILRVDKPAGPTSHDMVSLVRRAVKIRRIGHAGTLDPFATGLLLICVGWATRLIEYLRPLLKVYRGTIRLGQRTDTDDGTGSVTESEESWRQLDASRVRTALDALVGEIEQLPPRFSAKKVAGRRAYAIARAGGEPTLAPVAVTIQRLEALDVSLPDVHFEIECSSGTYVRSVARDVAESLGTVGHLAQLRRLRIGNFQVEGALRLEPSTPPATVRAAIRPPEDAVAHLPRVYVDRDALRAITHGQPIDWEASLAPGPVAVFCGKSLSSIADWSDGRLHPRKVFTRT